MQHNTRVSKNFLQSIIDKANELHGEHADPVIMIIDHDDVVHYDIYPIENGNDMPAVPSVTSIHVDPLGYVEPQPTDQC